MSHSIKTWLKDLRSSSLSFCYVPQQSKLNSFTAPWVWH